MKNKALSLFVAMALVSAFTAGAVFSQDSPVQSPCDSAKTAMHCEKKGDGGCCGKMAEACCKAAMTCPVSGKPASKEFFSEYNGGKVFFGCAECKAAFDKDPEKYASKIHVCSDSCKAAMKECCRKHEGKGECGKGKGMKHGCKSSMTCPVSGKPAGKEYFSEYKGNKVFFGCAECKAAFDKDPEKYASKIHVCSDSCKAAMKECGKKEKEKQEKKK